MRELVRKKQFRLGVGALAIALVGGLLVVFATPAYNPPTASADRIALAYARSLEGQDMPRTTPQALSSGWMDLGRCIHGQGRFFARSPEGPPEPLMLLYDEDDNLIGLNLLSLGPQPTPWVHHPIGIRTGLAGRDDEHWGTSIYVANPTDACGLQYRAADDDR